MKKKTVSYPDASSDPVVSHAADLLVPSPQVDDRRDWQRVIDDAGAVASVTYPPIFRLAYRRYVKVVAAIALLVLTIAIPALAVTRQWIFSDHGPIRTSRDFTVTSGTTEGFAWNLLAFTSSNDGLCLAIATSSNKSIGGGCGAEVSGESVTPESTNQNSSQSVGYVITSLPETTSEIVYGPVAEGVAIVTIRLESGKEVSPRIIAAPAGLDTTISFYAASLQSSEEPVAIVARSADGTSLQEISIPSP